VAWGVAIAGGLFTLLVAAMTEWLIRRRELAAVLAAENRRLYQNQRNVAESLQHSLLPEDLPQHPELEVASRYVAGITGIHVGGDWYDVVEVGPQQLAFVIGDVAGHGLEAARLMASLRFSFGAYAVEGNGPAEILHKLGRMVDVRQDDRFATVMCGVADLCSGEITLANAGHLPPVIIGDGFPHFLETAVGPPIGVSEGVYTSVSFTLRPGGTLLAFTDGLVERRDESLSAGLDRIIRAATTTESGTLDELLDEVCNGLVPHGSVDDIALLAFRRTSVA
jgi:serine phosphatase RsbU (regulator of sigma subunit)